MRKTYVMFAAAAIHVGTASTWMGERDRVETGAYIHAAGHRINHAVLASIQDASRTTGVNFGYLMAQAGRESAFRSDVGSRLSSAAGLYQFTAPTWMMLVKLHGERHGLGDMAAQIRRDSEGRYVAPAAVRGIVLELRRDPRLSALMAAEYAKDNRALLEQRLGRKVNTTDLYFAHFLGPYGAARFLKAYAETPNRPAVDAVNAAAARNNAPIFYERRKALSVAAVYAKIRHHIERPIEAYAHLEEARAWAAAWTETIETGAGRVVAAIPPPPPKPQPGAPAAAAIAQAELAAAEEPAGLQLAAAAEAEAEAMLAVLIAALPEEIGPAPYPVVLTTELATVGRARIDGALPPPGLAAVPAVNTAGPFRWLFGSLRTLYGEKA